MLSSAAQIIKDKAYKFFAPKMFQACTVKNGRIIGLCFIGKGNEYSIAGREILPLPAQDFPLPLDAVIDLFDQMPAADMGKFFILEDNDYQKISQNLPASCASLLQIYAEAARLRQNGQKNALLIEEREGELFYTFFLTDRINKARHHINNILPSLKEEMTILDEGNCYRAILGQRTIFVQYPPLQGINSLSKINDLSDFDKDDLKALTSACFYPSTCCGFFPSQTALAPIPWQRYCRHIGALGLIFLCFVGFFLKGKASALRQDIENAQGQILACHSLTQAEKDISQKAQERRQRQKKLLALEKMPYSNHMLLTEIASNLAEGAYLMQIERRSDELTICGRAETAQAADLCYKNFKRLLFCRAIAVDYSQREDGWLDFKFVLTLNGKAAASGDDLLKKRGDIS